MNQIGEKIKAAREAAALNYQQLSYKCKVPIGTIRAIESGERKSPRIETLEKIADALELSLIDFLTPG